MLGLWGAQNIKCAKLRLWDDFDMLARIYKKKNVGISGVWWGAIEQRSGKRIWGTVLWWVSGSEGSISAAVFGSADPAWLLGKASTGVLYIGQEDVGSPICSCLYGIRGYSGLYSDDKCASILRRYQSMMVFWAQSMYVSLALSCLSAPGFRVPSNLSVLQRHGQVNLFKAGQVSIMDLVPLSVQWVL